MRAGGGGGEEGGEAPREGQPCPGPEGHGRQGLDLDEASEGLAWGTTFKGMPKTQ